MGPAARPFSARKGSRLETAFSEASARFQRYRIWMVQLLSGALGEQALGDLADLLPALLDADRETACARLGVPARALRELLAHYASVVKELCRHPLQSAIRPGRTSVRTALRHLLVTSTEFDFAVTLILLALEDELAVSRTQAKFTLGKAKIALRIWEEHLRRFLSHESGVEEAWLSWLRERGLWAGRVEAPPVSWSLPDPLQIPGPPVSESIVQDRR